jgi:hypothetical protein
MPYSSRILNTLVATLLGSVGPLAAYVSSFDDILNPMLTAAGVPLPN